MAEVNESADPTGPGAAVSAEILFVGETLPPEPCPLCGGARLAADAACPHCEMQFMDLREAPKTLSRTFGIGTLMVVIAAVGLCFAVMRVLPVLGIALAAIATIGLARTFRGIAISKAIDWPLSPGDRLALGAESMGVAFLLLLCGGFVFALFALPLAALIAAVISPSGALIGAIASLVPTLFVIRRMSRELWPIRFH